VVYKKHIKFLIRLHKEHELIRDTWDEYNVYFWLLTGATLVGVLLKVPGLVAYILTLVFLRIVGTIRHHVKKHIKKHTRRKSKKY